VDPPCLQEGAALDWRTDEETRRSVGHDDESGDRRRGFRPFGCIAVGCLTPIVLGTLFLFLVPGGTHGEPTPTPGFTVARHLSASVSLDEDHPTAVQAFSVTASKPYDEWLEGNAAVLSAGHVRLTLLSDDTEALVTESRNESSVQLGRYWAYGGRHGFLPGRYVAVLELLEPMDPVNVTMSVEVRAGVSGLSTPPGFELRLDAIGRLQVQPVSVLVATYRQTIPVDQPPSERVLRLALAGAARPRSGGGDGRITMSVRAESYLGPLSPSGSELDAFVDTERISYRWGISDRYDLTGGVLSWAPAVVCPPDAPCTSDIAVDLRAVVGQDRPGSTASLASRSDASFTFLVQVRIFLIGRSAVPADASVSLELVSPPAPHSFPIR